MARRRRKPQSFNRFIGGKIKHGVARDQRRARVRRGEPKAAPFSMVDRVDRRRGRTTPLTPARNVPRLQRKAAAGRRARADYRAGKPVKTGGGKLQVKTAGGKPKTLSREQYRRALRQTTLDIVQRNREQRRKGHPDASLHAGPEKDLAERAGVGGLVDVVGKSTPFGKLGLNLAIATAEHPGEVAGTSVRTAKESIAGIPQAVKMLAEDPPKAVKQMAEDYERRYGPILEGDDETFRERVKTDYGLTPYALDAAGFAGGAGQVLGKAARSRAVGHFADRLERAGVAGGGKLKRVHTTTQRRRPDLRIAGGEKGVKRQRTSKNLLVAPMQHRLDRKRRQRFEAEAEAAGMRVTPEGKLERIKGAEPGRLRAVRPGPGEVLPIARRDRLREGPVLSRYIGRTERAHGHRKTSERVRMLTHSNAVEREARKLMKGLDKEEQRSLMYVMQFGLTPKHKAKAIAAMERYETMVKEGRVDEGEVLPFEPDELPEIRKIIENPDAHITPRVRQIADELRAIERREAAKDPDLTAERAADRRVMPQAILTGTRRAPDVEEFHGRLMGLEDRLRAEGIDPGNLVERYGHVGEVEPPDRLPLVRDIERSFRKERGKAERAVPVAERQAARVAAVRQERQQRGKPLPDAGVRAAEAELKKAKAERRRLGQRKGPQPLEREIALEHAEQRVREAKAKLEEATKQAPRVGDALVRKQREADRNVIHKRAARDDARIQHSVAAMIRKEVKRHPGRYEDSASFQARVERAITEAGLEAGAYFESSGGAAVRRSLKAVGSGARGVQGSKSYTGARLLTGRQSGDPEVVINGLLRNTKRRFSWRFTITTINQAAFEWSRGPHGGGLTARQLKREFDRRQINPDDIELVNVRVLENRELDAEGLERGQVTDPAQDASPTGGIHPDDLRAVHGGLEEAKISHEAMLAEAADTTPEGVRGQAFNRYVALARRDYQELTASMNPDSVVGRAIDIVWKQKPARVLLGLANTSWLAFQAMSNGFLSGLAGALNPFDYIAAQRWWKTLTPEQRLAIEPELGITHHMHHTGQDQTHLGAATNARLVNALRAFKQTHVMRTLHKGNPLDLMFRADEAQNNYFRKTVFYNQAKREAYKRMGANWKSVAGLQKKIESVLSMKRPEDRLRAVIEDAETFERHAEHVREWLGDYLSFTAKERAHIARSAMFYGYLRFSLRMVFWTMPVKHPVTAAILSDLGRMGSQEIKRLLGVPAVDGYRSEDVPTSMLAQAYYGTPAGLHDLAPGNGSINFGRMNPFLNSVTQMQNAPQIFGFFSPLFQMEIDQIESRSSFLDRTWRIKGQSTPGESERPRDYFGSFFSQFNFSVPGVSEGSPRGRILERQLLSLLPPYKVLEESGSFGQKLPLLGKIDPLYGSHSDDSLPWSPRPMGYKDPGAREGTERARRKDAAQGTTKPAVRRLMPLLGLIRGIGPSPTSAPIVLEREREKRKRRKGGGGGGGGGWDKLGGKGSGGSWGKL